MISGLEQSLKKARSEAEAEKVATDALQKELDASKQALRDAENEQDKSKASKKGAVEKLEKEKEELEESYQQKLTDMAKRNKDTLGKHNRELEKLRDQLDKALSDVDGKEATSREAQLRQMETEKELKELKAKLEEKDTRLRLVESQRSNDATDATLKNEELLKQLEEQKAQFELQMSSASAEDLENQAAARKAAEKVRDDMSKTLDATKADLEDAMLKLQAAERDKQQEMEKLRELMGHGAAEAEEKQVSYELFYAVRKAAQKKERNSINDFFAKQTTY